MSWIPLRLMNETVYDGVSRVRVSKGQTVVRNFRPNCVRLQCAPYGSFEMALHCDCRNGNWVSCPMSQVVSFYKAFDSKALNLSVSDLCLHRNDVPELSAGALEHEQD